ncbi:uncharacterized protein LOC129617201 [Condylostylus longicornis]|uniref:uncharacterized protein LOC129617201 n=1 Tax=Condylostylus longicornis TaxID=2530218 RepID=UPI00244E2A53|nr:uncharacterized protein LOC129617201 [Condylostylus longicornis]
MERRYIVLPTSSPSNRDSYEVMRIQERGSTVPKKALTSPQGFLEVTLDEPYFYYNDETLREALSKKGSTTNFYVWKSFGDTVTSVPVSIDESEREGRFVHRHASECGIHTRVSNTKKAPHGGGGLVNLLTEGKVTRNGRSEVLAPLLLKPNVHYDRVIELNERQVCDLELLINGGYSPLRGFMTKQEYESCVHDMRLPEGSLWGLPVVLDSHDGEIAKGERLLLRSTTMGGDLAVMLVEDIWKPDKTTEALKVFNTTSRDHPYIDYMKSEMGAFYVGGPIVRGIRLPERPWLPSQLRVATPAELRERYCNMSDVLAFQCRNPLHRAHVEMFTRSLHDGPTDNLQVVVHPSIGPSKQDDFDAKVRGALGVTVNFP